MKYFIFISIQIVLSACGVTKWDYRAESYIVKFEAQYKVSARTTSVIFGDLTNLPGTVLGQCYTGIGAPLVVLSESYWNAATEIERVALVYHELGHCVMKWDHTTDVDQVTKCPVSFMNTFMPSNRCLDIIFSKLAVN